MLTPSIGLPVIADHCSKAVFDALRAGNLNNTEALLAKPGHFGWIGQKIFLAARARLLAVVATPGKQLA